MRHKEKARRKVLANWVCGDHLSQPALSRCLSPVALTQPVFRCRATEQAERVKLHQYLGRKGSGLRKPRKVTFDAEEEAACSTVEGGGSRLPWHRLAWCNWCIRTHGRFKASVCRWKSDDKNRLPATEGGAVGCKGARADINFLNEPMRAK